MVWLGGHLDAMAIVGSVGALDVIVDDLKGAVCGSPVDNEMYNVTIVLLEHTVQRPLQHGCRIVGYRHIRYDHSR